MKIEALPDDFIDELFEDDKPKYVSEAEMIICPHCGCCEDPKHCVWGFVCPKCNAPQHRQCTESDGRLTGLHKERWDYAKRNELAA